MDNNAFYLKVAHAVSGCQLVEQELKLYITEALALIVKCLDGKLPFGMRGDDYANAPLKRLIDNFNKLSDQPQLVADLRRFMNERDFLSHRAIASCLDYDGEIDWGASSDMMRRLDAIQPEADRLVLAIHEAANQFRGYLWFDPIPDTG